MASPLYSNEIPDHYYPVAVWWQETRLKPLYIGLCRRYYNRPHSIGPKTKRLIASLGYAYNDLIDYRITPDDLLANEGISPIAEPSRKPKPTGPFRRPFLSDLRPPYGVLDPAVHFRYGDLRMLTKPAPLWWAGPERQEDDTQESDYVVGEWTKEPPDSFAQAWSWAIKELVAEQGSNQELWPPLIDKRAHLIFHRATLRRGSAWPICVDWRLSEPDFIKAMRHFYKNYIVPVQKKLGEEPPDRGTLEKQMEKATALHEVYARYGPISPIGLSSEEWASKIGIRAAEIHDFVLQEERFGGTDDSRKDAFRETYTTRCGLGKYWPYRHYGLKHLRKKAFEYRASPEYRAWTRTEAWIEQRLHGKAEEDEAEKKTIMAEQERIDNERRAFPVIHPEAPRRPRREND